MSTYFEEITTPWPLGGTAFSQFFFTPRLREDLKKRFHFVQLYQTFEPTHPLKKRNLVHEKWFLPWFYWKFSAKGGQICHPPTFGSIVPNKTVFSLLREGCQKNRGQVRSKLFWHHFPCIQLVLHKYSPLEILSWWQRKMNRWCTDW